MFDTLIFILEKQLKLYKSLYELAGEKTEMIKSNDIDGLNRLMTDEQKHITAITALEEERIREMEKLFPDRNPLPSLTDCIQTAGPHESDRLEYLYEQLTDILHRTKERNNLNQELIRQSLQFVNFNLQLLRRTPEQITYRPPAEQKRKTAPGNPSSLFNSKV